MSQSEMISPGYSVPFAAARAEANNTSPQSGVSWAAIIAGGVTASAISIMLLLLGSGLGLASVSPWSGQGISATAFTVLAAIWLIIVQWISSALGGYMAGRLRTKWAATHTDEVFFRDTAHGFLAWALGTLIVTAVLSSSLTAAANNAGHTAAMLAQNGNISSTYEVNLLFRQNANPAAQAAGAGALGTSVPGADVTPVTPPAMPAPELHQEASAILAEGAANGGVSQADSAYLVQLVSEATGLAPADAQARVTDVLNREQADITKARQIADATRKSASQAAIFTFVSLLVGAFIASVAGAIGGRLRDTY